MTDRCKIENIRGKDYEICSLMNGTEQEVPKKEDTDTYKLMKGCFEFCYDNHFNASIYDKFLDVCLCINALEPPTERPR